MARIRSIEDHEVDNGLREIFQASKKRYNVVPNIIRTLAHWPDYLRLFWITNETMFEDNGGSIDPATRHMIALLVCRNLHCHYGYAWHMLNLRQLGVSSEMVAALSESFRNAELSDRQKTILAYAEKMTRSAYAVSDREIDRLKSHDLGDKEIVTITAVTAFTTSYAQIALALGVPFES